MIKKALSSSAFIFSFMALISFCALAAAFISEAFLGLEPCQLCIYQRYPFALGITIGLIGLALGKRSTISSKILLGIGSMNFLINSGVAFYHTGVEQHWWQSHVGGCSMVFPESSKNQSILENIMSAPMGDCSKIPWQDPIFGLSMANLNIGLCLGLAVIFLIGIFTIKAQDTSKEEE